VRSERLRLLAGLWLAAHGTTAFPVRVVRAQVWFRPGLHRSGIGQHAACREQPDGCTLTGAGIAPVEEAA
jgi:hypothetical protein